MAQKKRLEEINILGDIFKIEYPAKIKGDEGENTYGETYGVKRLIRISTQQNKTDDMMERTLLHEVIHAILHISGHSELLEDKEEESLVVLLENGLSKLYKRR